MIYDRPTVRALATDHPVGSVTFAITVHLPSELVDPLFDHARAQEITLDAAVAQAVRLALFPPILLVKLDRAGVPSLELVPAGSERG